MQDRFWDDALEHLLTLQTAEERDDYLRGYSFNVAECLRVALVLRVKEALRDIEKQLGE